MPKPANILTSALALSTSCAVAASASEANRRPIPIYEFTQGSGYSPYTGIVYSRFGIFGVTSMGASKRCIAQLGCGSIYRLSYDKATGWTEETLHRLTEKTEGLFAAWQLTVDDKSNVYGYSGTTVFELSPPGQGSTAWAYQALYKFHGRHDGYPLYNGPPLIYRGGHLFGVAGSAPNSCGAYGCGSLFRLDPGAGGTLPWTKTTLYEFPRGNGHVLSLAGFDATGGLFVSTAQHRGAVQRLAPAGKGQPWTATIISKFTGGPDGADPTDLVLSPNGSLFGLSSHRERGGLVFELTPPGSGATWTRTLIGVARMRGYPATAISLGPNGSIIGVTWGDQDLNFGNMFQFTPPQEGQQNWTYTQLWNFNYGPDQNPNNVVTAPNGEIFGVLSGGGYGNGTLFEWR